MNAAGASFGTKFNNALTKIGKVGKAVFAGLAIAAGAVFVGAIKKAADFELGMAKVKAITGANAEEFENLTEKAKQLGLETAQTMTDIATGMEAFARAGFTATEIVIAMDGAVALAESQVMDLGEAVRITGAVLNGMNMEVEESTRVANALAATASSSATNVSEIAEAMKYLAPVAAALNVPLEEALTVVGKLADAGLRGGRATRALATALEGLADPTDEAAAALEKLSIDTFDAEGNFIGIIELVGQLEESFEDLEYTAEQKMAAMGAIFAGSAGEMNILINETRTELEMYQDSITGTQTAFDQQAAMLDTVSGQWQILKGSIELLLVTIGGPALTAIQGFITNSLIPWVNKMTEAAEGTSLFDTAIKKIIAPFEWMIDNGQKVKTALIAIGVGLAAIVTYNSGILGLATALATLIALMSDPGGGFAEITMSIKDLNDEMTSGAKTMEQMEGLMDNYIRSVLKSASAMEGFENGATPAFHKVQFALIDLTDSVTEMGDRLEETGLSSEDIAAKMAATWIAGVEEILAENDLLAESLDEVRASTLDTADSTETLNETIDNARTGIEEVNRLLAEYRAGQEGAADDTDVVVVALTKLEKEYNELMLAFTEATDGSREQADALKALQGFYDGLTGQVETLGDYAIDANDELLTMIATLETQGAITAEMIAAAIKAIEDEEAARSKAEKARLKGIEDRERAAEKLRLAEHGLWEETQELIKANEESIEGGQRQADTLQALQGIYDEVISNLDALGISTEEASEETQLMIATLERAGVVTVAMTKAQEDLEQALKDKKTAEDAAEKAAKEHTATLKAQAKEFLNLAVTMAKDVVNAYKKMKQEAEDWAQSMRDIEEEFADKKIENAEDNNDALEEEALRHSRKLEDIDLNYERAKADVRAEDYEDAQDYLDKLADIEEDYRQNKQDAEIRNTRALTDIDDAYTEAFEDNETARIDALKEEREQFIENRTTIFDTFKALKDKVIEYAADRVIENWIDGISDSWAGVTKETELAEKALSNITTTGLPALGTALGTVAKILAPLAIGFGLFNDEISEAGKNLTKFLETLGFGTYTPGGETYRVTGAPTEEGAAYLNPDIQSGEYVYPEYDPSMDSGTEITTKGGSNSSVNVEINYGGVVVSNPQDAEILARETFDLFQSRLRAEGVRA